MFLFHFVHFLYFSSFCSPYFVILRNEDGEIVQLGLSCCSTAYLNMIKPSSALLEEIDKSVKTYGASVLQPPAKQTSFFQDNKRVIVGGVVALGLVAAAAGIWYWLSTAENE